MSASFITAFMESIRVNQVIRSALQAQFVASFILASSFNKNVAMRNSADQSPRWHL